MTATRLIRINGIPYRIPESELPDPYPNLPGGTCRYDEPDNPYGAAVCTLDQHGSEVMHIGHNGAGQVIAIWGEPAFPQDTDCTVCGASERAPMHAPAGNFNGGHDYEPGA